MVSIIFSSIFFFNYKYSFSTDCLRIIVDSFEPKRTKQFIINKMIEIGLIATKDEILPSKRKKAAKTARNNDSDSDDETVRESVDMDRRPVKNVSKQKAKKPASSNKSLNVAELRSLLDSLDADLKPVLAWIEQSLNDAADDIDDEDPSDDPDDCVPLVPFADDQRSAIETDDFQHILKRLGFQKPASESAVYWRIPHDFTAADIRLRSRIVAGLEVEDDLVEPDQPTADVSEAESEDYDFEKAKLTRADTLVYNQSDDDDEPDRISVKPYLKKKKNAKAKRKFDIFDMVKDDDVNADQDEADESADFIGRQALLNNSDSDAEPTIINQSTKRSKRAVIESDEDENEENLPSVVNQADSSGEIMDSLVMEEDSPRKPVKRIRSLESDGFEKEPDEDEDDEIVVTHQVKRKRAAVISDDDDDDD